MFDPNLTDRIAQKAAKIMEKNWAKMNAQTAQTQSPSNMHGADDYMVIDGKMVLRPRLPSNSSSPGIRIDSVQGGYQSPNAVPVLPEPVPLTYSQVSSGPSGSGTGSGMRDQDFRGQGLAGIRSLPSQAPENTGQIQSTDPEIQKLVADQRLKEQQDRMTSSRRVQLLDVRNEASYVQTMNPGFQNQNQFPQNQNQFPQNQNQFPQRQEGRRMDQGYQSQGNQGNQGQGYRQYNAQLNQVGIREQEELRKRNATFQDAYANSLSRRNPGH